MRNSPEEDTSSKPITLSKVLLPEPEVPTSATNSPRLTCNEISCKTWFCNGVPALKILLSISSCNTTCCSAAWASTADLDITNRHCWIIFSRAAGWHHGGDHPSGGGNDYCRNQHRRLQLNIKQALPQIIKHLHQAVADQYAQ